jgi:hypothetical protein
MPYLRQPSVSRDRIRVGIEAAPLGRLLVSRIVAGNDRARALTIKRLDEQAGRLERHASGPSVEALVTEERARSHQYGGRSVFGAEPPPGEFSGRPCHGNGVG